MKKYLFIFVFILIGYTSQSQVLISLLFGDKLNSEKIEFGLVGGLNRSYWNDVSTSEGTNNFNIGFYFHFLMNENSYLSTGVLVKSNMGAKGMPTYLVDDPEFDDVFKDAELKTKVSYFYVPLMYQQRFNNRWYIEGGFQPGLRNKAYDNFEISEFGGDITYKVDVRDQYKRLDIGLIGGAGYKLKKQTKSTAIGINYYYGLVDVSKIPDSKRKNSSIYLYCKIPIGTGSVKEKKKN
jgi:hypothetical protein